MISTTKIIRTKKIQKKQKRTERQTKMTENKDVDMLDECEETINFISEETITSTSHTSDKETFMSRIAVKTVKIIDAFWGLVRAIEFLTKYLG